MPEFKDRIRELRKARDLTQTELAELMDFKTYTTVSKWESGDNLPRGKELKRLAEYFHVSSDYLLGLSDAVDGERTSIQLVYEMLNEEEKLLVYDYAIRLLHRHTSSD